MSQAECEQDAPWIHAYSNLFQFLSPAISTDKPSFICLNNSGFITYSSCTLQLLPTQTLKMLMPRLKHLKTIEFFASRKEDKQQSLWSANHDPWKITQQAMFVLVKAESLNSSL